MDKLIGKIVKKADVSGRINKKADISGTVSIPIGGVMYRNKRYGLYNDADK